MAAMTALVVAAVVVAAGSITAGMAARGQARAQAKSAKIQAEQERRKAAFAERDFKRRQRAAAASVRAAGGARGVDVGSGSPLLAALDFGAETERQALRIREGGEVRANRLENQASLLRAQGKAAMMGGFFGGAGGAAKVAAAGA